MDAPWLGVCLLRRDKAVGVSAMERPVYHIKGVVKEKKELPADFVGPLDLILHLLRKNKIEIRDIPIADILRQYLEWMDARREMNLEVAGEFITMASQLMLLKTRMLLHEEDEETMSELEALMASLEAQQRKEDGRRIREVLSQLEEGYSLGRNAFTKGPEKEYARRVYRYEHDPEDLLDAIAGWRARQGRKLPPALTEFRGILRPEPYRVERKAEEIMRRLHAEGPVELDELIAESESKSEVTAAFLALLELCRAGKLHITGEPEAPVISLRETAS